ncbi:MAG TPA: hypothetical protein VM901_11770 [Bdellovibrionota bacterium]|jgi:A/G-specific adenine glycosylase|nr:hypothetical protein [Bdellovibrionota bacterium]
MMLHALQSWFDIHQRHLPWRREPAHPYEIWISEVMSQQSVLETVKKYFTAWMQSFPDLEALGRADEAQVMARWAGLGYYSRARLVIKSAEALLARQARGEGWPQNVDEWRALPGIGPYTAKAISAIAFGEPVLPLDGNLIRVLSRFYGISDPLNRTEDMRQVEARAADLEAVMRADPALRAGRIAQAFMDLGATVCRPKAAAICAACPIREQGCFAEQNQCVDQIPRTKARRESVYLDYVARPSFDERGRVWVLPIEKGAPGNLLGQWQIPLELIDASSPHWECRSQVRHAITHHRYRVRVMGGGSAQENPAGRWVDPESSEWHLSTLSRKILSAFLGSGN